MRDQETIEVETIEDAVDGGTAIGAVEQASISQQIATAKQYPRSVDRSLKEALSLATLDEETAASCFYALPRSGKTIEGPSARLAEIMAYSWGNLRVDADIIAEDRTHITAVGTCFDLQKNVAVRVRVKRRITGKNGQRYNEDMIGVTSNAAISIALRNAVFKVIPQAFTRRIYGEARRASLGQGGTITQKRQKALGWFGKLGISEEQVFEVLSVRGIDDIGEDELITLRGMVTAIQEGDSTAEEMFRRHDASDGSEELNQALGGNGKAKKPKAKPKPKKKPEPEPEPEAPTVAQQGDEDAGLGLAIEERVKAEGLKLSDVQLEAGVRVVDLDGMGADELVKVWDWLEKPDR